jgi:hypothetical protein
MLRGFVFSTLSAKYNEPPTETLDVLSVGGGKKESLNTNLISMKTLCHRHL